MKKLLAILVLIFFIRFYCVAQERIELKTCNDTLITHQADSLKILLSQAGFQLLKENFISMESEYETPIVVPLTEGVLYHFVFIGEYSSRLYEVRMYEGSGKQIAFQQKRWGDVEGNIISFSFNPQTSQAHIIKSVQLNKKKKKNLCGYVMLLKKVGNAEN